VYTSSSRAFVAQAGVMKESRIVISTHGAFETNLIYMNDNSLYIELKGYSDEWIVESNNYKQLAQLFLIYHQNIKIKNLVDLKQPKYNITLNEMNDIKSLINDYLLKVYKIN
jgi:hypothetical protein